MRDISELDAAFDSFINRLKTNLIEAQDHATETMYEDAIDRIDIPAEARNIQQFIDYYSSIKRSETKLEDDRITSSVYSDLVVGGNSKWAHVPIGAFLEWGTGPLGEGTNDFPHGYPYTTEAPWDLHTEVQFKNTNTWGIAARPHMYPALVNAKGYFIENVKEAIDSAWKK